MKPGFVSQVLDEPFDLCIIDDCQMMLNKRYFPGMEKLAEDYKIIKKIRAERIDVLLYQHEKQYLERLDRSRSSLRTMLGGRMEVFRDLGLISRT